MDNPWANGWNDEVTTSTDIVDPSKAPASSSWIPSHHTHSSSLNDTQEVDISMPSWSTGANVKWTEPSPTGGSLWTSQQVDGADSAYLDAWGSTTFKGISLTPSLGTHEMKLEEHDEEDIPPPSHMHVINKPPSPIPSPSQEITIPTPPKIPSPPPEYIIPVTLPRDIDNFGTFETGLASVGDNDEDPWSSSAAVFPPETEKEDQWDSAWSVRKDTHEDGHEEEERLDEWEAARRMKQKMNQQMPPELLSSILQQCSELSDDLWPTPEDPPMDKDDYRADIRSGMDGVQGLAFLAEQLAPEEVYLPPAQPFTSTHTHKSLTESLKLSRHLPVSRRSPMAILMASRGSMAWETSIKSRPETIHDDAPVGWRVVENENKDAVSGVAENAKKAAGGLFSLWGRKTIAANPTPAWIKDSKERSLSPTAKTSTSASVSPRSSVDMNIKTPSVLDQASPPLASLPPESSSTQNSGTGTAPLAGAAQDFFDVPEAPSAVSRFLGRFSRTRSNRQYPNRHTLALSGDDMDFLSDFVPSASDADEDPDHLGGFGGGVDVLSGMIQSSPLPTKLPPPLAPPPGPAPRSGPVSSAGTPTAQNDALELLFNISAPEPDAPTSSRSPLVSSPLRSSPPMVSSRSASGSSKSTSPQPHTFTSITNRPLSSFTLPPPSSSRSQTPAAIMTPQPFLTTTLPPPPKAPSRPHTPKPSITSTALLSDSFGDDDDDFSDFHSPPMRVNPLPNHHQQLSTPTPSNTSNVRFSPDTSFSPNTSQRPLFSQEEMSPTTSKLFDDFDDSITPSSAMQSPPPPQPPANPSRQNILTPPPKTSPHHHQRNRSIPTQSTPLNFDFLSNMPPPGSTSWMNTAPLTSNGTGNGMNGLARQSPPPLSNPKLGGAVQQPLFGVLNSPPAKAPSPSSQSTGVKGGLSAQDLSFFEGL